MSQTKIDPSPARSLGDPVWRPIADGHPVTLVGLLYIISCLFESIQIGPATPSQLLGAVFLGLWAVELCLGRRVGLSALAVPMIPFAVLVVWSAATAFWSVVPTFTVTSAVSVASLSLSAVAIADVFRDRLWLVAAGLSCGATLAAVFTLITPKTPVDLTDPLELQGVAQASFGGTDENLLGFQITIGIAATCYLLFFTRVLLLRLVLFVPVLLMTAAILRIGSKTGAVAGLAVAVLLVLVYARRPRDVLMAVVAVGLVGVTFVAFDQAGLIPQRLTEFLDSPEVIDSRLEIIELFQLTQDNWQLFGVGSGADADYLLVTQGEYLNAHGSHWKILIELGIVGVVIWLAVVVSLVVGTLKLGDKRFVMLCLGPILAFSWTLGPTTSNTLWVVFGVCLSGYLGRRIEVTAERTQPRFDTKRALLE